MNQLCKKLCIGLFSCLLLLSGCTPKKEVAVTPIATPTIVPASETDNADFEDWMNKEFKEMMEADYMNLHYTLANPEDFDITIPEATLGEISQEEYTNSMEDSQESLKELEEFEYTSLSKRQQVDYDSYKFYLEKMYDLNKYPLLDWWFLPSVGIQDNLNTNFDEFVFRKQSDIDDYLSLLEDYSRYLNEALEITKWQASEGYFMQDYMVDSTVDAINEFIERTDDNALVISFNDKLVTFMGLSDEDVTTYKERNKDIILNTLIPTYKTVVEELESLKGTADPEKVGYSFYENGEDYYKTLVSFYSSSNEDIESINDDLQQYIERQYAVVQAAIKGNEEAYTEATTFELQPEEPEVLLNLFEQKMYEFVPQGANVEYRASYLDQSIANDSTLAYYLTPTLDDTKDNVIKINEAATKGDTIGMFATLAHEGFPGHCYQINYFFNTNPNKLIESLNFTGYTEGWAMHAELYSYNWLELENEGAIEVLKLDTTVGYALAAMTDIGINYYGWTPEEYLNFAKMYYGDGIGLEDVRGQYEYISSMPGRILSYGVGMMKMENMMEKAKSTLGKKYSDVEFNEVVLNYGSRPYELVEQDVDAYIASKQ